MTVVALLILLAPAPISKPLPPPPVIKPGGYTMTWHSTQCQTYFHRDGFYACLWHGKWWHGHWKMEKDGYLFVQEWPLDREGYRGSWRVKMATPLTGSLGGSTGVKWKVVPLEGKVW